MAGFIEFSMMRTKGDIDQKLLGELLYQYMNVEEDFIKDLFYSLETKLGRVFVNEDALEKTRETQMDICMTFGNVANSLINNGYARRVDKIEGIDLLQQAYNSNLVQCGENVREGVTFICNCCGCCCEALVAAKKFRMMHPVETTNFLLKINHETCINCGKCLKVCPVNVIKKIQGEYIVQEELYLVIELWRPY